MPSRIDNYALIGDCETAALVARRLQRLAVLAALRLGRLLHRPAWRPRARPPVARRGRSGAVTVVDFMPPGTASDLVRIVFGHRGRVTMWTELVLRFDYGSAVPWVAVGRLVGDFPQAFSHLALANSARDLAPDSRHTAQRT